MADKKVFTAESLPLDPIALARYYHHGLKARLWTSIPTAQAALKDSGILVSRDVFLRALRVYRLPNSVLELFDEVHLTNAAANTLLVIVKRDGLSMLLQRSETINAKDLPSREAILEALGKSLNEKEIVPGSEIAAFPLLLAKEYFTGLESGKWSTQAEACKILQVPRHHIVYAIQISRLPLELLELFSPNDSTFRVGRRLYSLTQTTSPELLISRASQVLAERKPLPPAAAFAVLLQKETPQFAAGRFENPQIDSVLIVAKMYEIGKRELQWSTMANADKLLGFPENTVGRAVRVSKLPQVVLKLLGGDQISHKEGKRLLSIVRLVGPHALLKNARSASKLFPKPSRENLFALFAGASVSREVKQLEVSFHVTTNGHAAHIRISGHDVVLLGKYLDEITGWCDFLVARESAKKTRR
jgi:hypothetical protein